MHSATRVNDPDDLESVIPEENPEHPGFYFFPDDRRLSVSPDGRILNNKTKKLLKSHKNTDTNAMCVVFTSPGVRHANYRVHRIIARTFIGRPSRHLDKPFRKLEVNHIDGNRANNSIDNLEWVIGQENIQHAHANNVHSADTPVLAMHKATREIKRFSSLSNCAASFGISHVTLFKHLKTGNSGKAHVRGYVFKYDDDTEWIDYPVNTIRPLGNRLIDVVVRNVSSETSSIFGTLKEAATFFNLPYRTLWGNLKKYGKIRVADLEFSLVKKSDEEVILEHGEVIAV